MAKDHGSSVKDDKTYEDQRKEQLRKRAAEVGIEGRSKMDKSELVDALRNH